MEIWILDELDDGRIELTAPNGEVLMRITKDTAELVGRMLLDAAEEEDDELSDDCSNGSRFVGIGSCIQ